MAYVPVPNDLSRIKTKLAFNLTKRQLICFSIAGGIGIPFYACKGCTCTSSQTGYGRTNRAEQPGQRCTDCSCNTAQRRTDRRYDTGKTAA